METTEKQSREKYSQTKAQLIEIQGNSLVRQFIVIRLFSQVNTND